VREPLDLTSLECFVTAARLESFRGAARACHLSPSAFGDRIRRLEEQLGVPLFARTTRHLALTPAGERMRASAERALDSARACYDAVGAKSNYTLTLGTRYELGMSWLVPAIDALEAALPGLTAHLYFGDGKDLLRALDHGEADAVITSSRLAVSGFRYALLHEEHYRFVASRSLLKRNPFTSPEHASRHRLLDVSEDLPLFRYLLDAGSAKTVWDFQSVVVLGTIAAIRQRVLDGAGVAVLPEYFVRDDLRTRRLGVLLPQRRLQPDWFRLVYKARHPREAELQALADLLRARPLR
jgi:DNA-binding transcriptional LysR family regulator